jgi:hypothetical protein
LRLGLLLLRRRPLRTLARLTRAAASAATSALARRRLFTRRELLLGGSRLSLLLRLLRTVGTRSPRLRLLFSALLLRLLPLPVALALLLATGRLLLLLLSLLASRLLSGALLELAHLLLHVARRLPGLPGAQLVVPAVRAALPAFGIGLLAGVAEDAFRERHREIGAHCTLRTVVEGMDETRRRTLLTLIELAGENSPSACWDDRRAIELLRREATPEELRELGMDEQMIAHVFAEEHAG